MLAAIFLAAYLPDLGHGFLKDDFGWVLRARGTDGRGLLGFFDGGIGFYRPLVSGTFAADHAIWKLNPFGYGMTNLALCLADVLLLFALARRLALPTAAAVLCAAVWAFNFHGINMALLWMSGRTALLVVLFVLATALAMLRSRFLLAGFLCLCAMLSKEEAVMLPALWTAFVFMDGRSEEPDRSRSRGWRPIVSRLFARTWPLWTALGIYASIRRGTRAFDPSNAPPEYQLFTSLSLLGTNIVEYADRAGTIFVFVAIVCVLVVGRRVPGLSDSERRTLRLAALWIPAGFALTISLPVRSSLYVLLPSVGSALAAGAFASRALRANPRRFAQAATALVVIVLLLVPVYRARNRRWVDGAKLASQVVEEVRTTAARHPNGGHILLIDDPAASPNFESSFLTAFPEAVTLVAGSGWTGEIVPSVQQSTADKPAMIVVIELEGGVLVPHRIDAENP